MADKRQQFLIHFTKEAIKSLPGLGGTVPGPVLREKSPNPKGAAVPAKPQNKDNLKTSPDVARVTESLQPSLHILSYKIHCHWMNYE